MKMIDRTSINKIVSNLSKAIKDGVNDDKSNIFDVLVDDKVTSIIGNTSSCTVDWCCTLYSYVLGRYDGRVTRANLNQDDVKGFGCARIDKKDAILDIVIYHNDEDDSTCESVDIQLVVNVEWMDKYSNWHSEYCILKTWKVL